jgi:hypothetical protein
MLKELSWHLLKFYPNICIEQFKKPIKGRIANLRLRIKSLTCQTQNRSADHLNMMLSGDNVFNCCGDV